MPENNQTIFQPQQIPPAQTQNAAFIVFEGQIDQQATTRIFNAITQFTAQNFSKIIIFFSSLGGSIYEGFLLATIIQNSKIPIAIHATNHIDSIANVIFLSARERSAESHAKFYLHGASTGNGNFDEKGLREKLSEIKTHNGRIAYFISENTALPLKRVQAMMKAGTSISAQDALKYEIVMEVAHKEIPTNAVRTEIIYIN